MAMDVMYGSFLVDGKGYGMMWNGETCYMVDNNKVRYSLQEFSRLHNDSQPEVRMLVWKIIELADAMSATVPSVVGAK